MNELPDIHLGFPLNRHWLNEGQIMAPAAGSTALLTYEDRKAKTSLGPNKTCPQHG